MDGFASQEANCSESETEPELAINPRKKKAKKELPPALQLFTIADRECIECREEILHKPIPGFKVGNKYWAAHSIFFNNETFVLEDLHSDLVKKLASNLGIKRTSYMQKFEVRLNIYKAKEIANAVEGVGINLPTKVSTKGLLFNAMVRLTNVLFSPDFFHAYRTINEQQNRIGFVTLNGSDHMMFWCNVSNACNDSERNDDFGRLMYTEVDDPNVRHHLAAAVKIGEINPCVTEQVTYKSSRKYAQRLVRVRNEVIRMMGLSGESSSDDDIMNYVGKALNACSLMARVGIYPAYYFIICAKYSPGFDQHSGVSMPNTVKDGSTNVNDANNETTKTTNETNENDDDNETTQTTNETKGNASSPPDNNNSDLEVRSQLQKLTEVLNTNTALLEKGVAAQDLAVAYQARQMSIQEDDSNMNKLKGFFSLLKEVKGTPLERLYRKKIADLNKLLGVDDNIDDLNDK